jgi:SAM-dependent methyltransferase
MVFRKILKVHRAAPSTRNPMSLSYTGRFTAAPDVQHYENAEYAPESYSSWIWELQRPYVQQEIEAVREQRSRIRLLDFACGTGRVLSFVETLADESIGLDISAEMLGLAAAKCRKSTLIKGNLAENLSLVTGSFDVVTMFRFILNAGPELSSTILRILHPLLLAGGGRLICNVHGNSHSLRRFALAARLSGRSSRSPKPGEQPPMLEQMSPRQIENLFRQTGYRIVSSYGFGLFPRMCYRGTGSPVFKACDRIAAGNTWLKWVSTDLLFVCEPVASRNASGLS